MFVQGRCLRNRHRIQTSLLLLFVAGSEDTVSASGDELIEPEDNYPATRSRTSSQEESGEELSGPPTTRSRADSGALLDMLAEVASQKLLFSPMKRKPGYDYRRSDSDGSLTIAQVKALSTNQLIKLFSTTEFNEMKKLYSFYCAFDQSCEAKFISFGNENRAKEKFKKHLLQHLETLKANETETVARPSKKRRANQGKRRKVKDMIKEEVEEEYLEEDDKALRKPRINWDEPFMISDLTDLPSEPKVKFSSSPIDNFYETSFIKIPHYTFTSMKE